MRRSWLGSASEADRSGRVRRKTGLGQPACIHRSLPPLAAALTAREKATIEIRLDSQHLHCSETSEIARGGMIRRVP
jgi:hypothetical protein